MSTVGFKCGKCGLDLCAPIAAPPMLVKCPHCSRQTEFAYFPALFREVPQGNAGATLLIDSESSCFYHASKKAESICEHCGRFLCALCDIDINGIHSCPSCIEQGAAVDNAPAAMQARTVYYDELALKLAVYPIIFVWPVIFTAPMAIYMTIRYWKKQKPVVPRNRWRFVAATAVASLELAVIAFFVAGIFI